MCGISFLPYRDICRRFGAGMAVTQMVAAPALIHRDDKTARIMMLSDAERPVTVQLLGKDAEQLAAAARIVQDAGADCVDINMGCPAKKIVGSGGGSALMRDAGHARAIFRAVRHVLTVPFTIKIRAGWDEENRNFLEIAKIAQEEGVDAVCLHARTKTAAYKGYADWELIRQLREALSIPVIGNGDIKEWRDAHRMMAETGCAGVMIGRASFEAPWIFKSILLQQDYEPTLAERRELLLEQYRGMALQFGERNGVVLMRKFICAYTKGMPGGTVFRQEVMKVEALQSIERLIQTFFEI